MIRYFNKHLYQLKDGMGLNALALLNAYEANFETRCTQGEIKRALFLTVVQNIIISCIKYQLTRLMEATQW